MSDRMPAPSSVNELHERASRPPEAVIRQLSSLSGDILVLGAGGKMGYHLSAMLQRGLAAAGASNRLYAVSRFGSSASQELFRRSGIAAVACDLTHPADLQALPDAAHIFFLAGVKFGASDDADLLHRMNVALPASVGQRFRGARIVALSTGCVYSYVAPESGGSSESDPAAPVGAYAQSCLGREQAFADSGASCCLIRLNYSVDLQYGVLVDVASKVLQGQPVDVTMGYANVIWQGDAIAAIIQSLELASSPPRVLNVTGSRILSIRDVAERFGRLFQKPVTIIGQEAPTAWLNNASRSHALFGLPTVGEDTLLEWVADWLQHGRPTLGKPTHFEVRDGVF